MTEKTNKMSSHDNASHIEYLFFLFFGVLLIYIEIILHLLFKLQEQDCSRLWSQWTIEMESCHLPTSPESSYFKGTD